MTGVTRSKGVYAGIVILLSALFFAPVIGATDWSEKVSVNGDLRYRHETVDKEDKDARHRHRIRVRVGIFAEANDKIDIGIQMATGSDDPVSTNQTLDNAFSTKDFRLDLAYFKFTTDKFPGFTFTGGKFKNPFYKPGKSELIWDSDWNPEGGVATYNHNIDNFDLTLIGSGIWIDERSSSNDSYLMSGQAVARLHLSEEKSNIAFGGSIYNYGNAKGFQPFFDDEEAMGNSLMDLEVDGDTISVYANEYEIVEIFAEVNLQFESIPITIMGDVVTNTGADSLNTGWLVGLRVGKAKKIGTWELRYNYREVEKDAVIGMFTDSDFRGGGTDARGHEIGGAYQLAKNAAFKLTYFMNEIGLDQDNTDEFQRLQVDLQLKF